MVALNERIGKNVRKIRDASGLSQGSFGERLGVTGNYIWYIEHGERRPSFELMLAIARIGGVTVDQLSTTLPDEVRAVLPVLWIAREPDLDLESDPDLATRLMALQEKLDQINHDYVLRHADDPKPAKPKKKRAAPRAPRSSPRSKR